MNIYILVTIILFCLSYQCELNGKIEGQCLSSKVLKDDLHFCSKVLHSYICVPYSNTIWEDWTNKTIDETVERKTIKLIETEFLNEINGKVSGMPLINNLGCYEAYVTLICQLNFHQCDPSTDTTIPLCKSVCDTFLSKCGTFSSTLCESYPTENCQK